jgi:hypothetical protein
VATRKQIWRPDTCGCVLEQTYDPDLPASTWTAVPISKCSAHAAVPDGQIYNVLYQNADGENKRKNQFIGAALGYEIGDVGLGETKTNPDGSTYITFKAGVTVTWTFSGEGAGRVLNVTISGANLNASQKNAIATFCTNRFGAGRVVITYT